MELESSSYFVQQIQDDHTNLEDDSVCIDACTHLQNMPDLCLIVIFSDRKLNLMDLCNIAESCERFRSITQSVIGKTLTFTSHESTYQFLSDKYNLFNVTRSDAERMLKIFGWCVKEALIGSRHLQLECCTVSLITQHCDEGLKDLVVYGIRIPAKLTNELKSVLKRLHSLQLYTFAVDGNKTLFSGLDSLVELTVEDVRNCKSILENVFPQLKRFTYAIEKSYERIQETSQAESLKIFIKNHPGLKFLDIFLQGYQNWWMNINEAISSSCSELHELHIHSSNTFIPNFNVTLKPLQALKSLRKMTLTTVSLRDFEVFALMAGLRELRLERSFLPTNANEFDCLVQLTKLFLMRCVSGGTYGVADIIQPLVNLVKLKLVDVYDHEKKIGLNATTFSNIVKIVEGRPNVLKLICRCHSSVQRVANQNVKLFPLSRK